MAAARLQLVFRRKLKLEALGERKEHTFRFNRICSPTVHFGNLQHGLMLIFSVVIFVFSTLTLSHRPLCLEKWGSF